MIELMVLLLLAVGGCWLFGALVIGMFKLTFGLAAAVFGGVFALLGVAAAAVFVVPILLFALLPMLLPALGVAALVWLVVRAARPRHPASRRQLYG